MAKVGKEGILYKGSSTSIEKDVCDIGGIKKYLIISYTQTSINPNRYSNQVE